MAFAGVAAATSVLAPAPQLAAAFSTPALVTRIHAELARMLMAALAQLCPEAIIVPTAGMNWSSNRASSAFGVTDSPTAS